MPVGMRTEEIGNTSHH